MLELEVLKEEIPALHLRGAGTVRCEQSVLVSFSWCCVCQQGFQREIIGRLKNILMADQQDEFKKQFSEYSERNKEILLVTLAFNVS